MQQVLGLLTSNLQCAFAEWRPDFLTLSVGGLLILLVVLVAMDGLNYGRVLNASGATSALMSSFYGIEPGSFSMISDNKEFPPTEEPVWLLGRKYSTLHELDDLMADFRSRLWITYRSGFAPIGGVGPSTDSGWGCMLRCGQMVVAQALIVKHLGRDWRWSALDGGSPGSPEKSEKYSTYQRILGMFIDQKNCCYSIHQIAQMGAVEGKPVGTWFGPNTIAQALKKLSVFDHWNDMVIHVAMDNMVVISDIKASCRRKVMGADKSDWKSLLLFIPLRVGLSEINPIYFRALKATFKLQQSLGIIGGRPNHALYFIGNVGNELVYLDPHKTQSLTTPDQDQSYHCNDVLRLDVKHLDPSISLCFFCHTEADFDNWCVLVKRALINNEKQPLFELAREKAPQWPSNPQPIEIAQDAMKASSDSFAHYDMGGVTNSFSPTHSLPSVESASDAFTIINRTVSLNDSDEDFELLG